MHRTPRHAGTLAPAVVPVLAVVVLAVAGCGSTPSDPPDAARATTSPAGSPSQTPSETPSETPSTTRTEPPATGPAPAPGLVYFAGARARTGRLLLFPERAPSDGGDRLLAAVRAATAGTPDDPDHRTLWGGDVVEAVSFDGVGDAGQFSVRLVDDGASTALPGMTPREAELAVQQVVWTLQSVGRTRAPVAFHVGGSDEPLTSLLGVPATGPDGAYVAEDGEDVLNHVAVLTPSDGATVTGTVVLQGVAESFEATVAIRATSADGEVVHDWSTSAEQCCGRLWPWRSVLDTTGWAPGTYVVEARTDDAVGIANGSDGPEVDTRTIVVG